MAEYITTPSFELRDPEENRRLKAEFIEKYEWVEVPGVGWAVLPRDPVERERVLRAEI